jgi:ABC-2 type transport system permease protein
MRGIISGRGSVIVALLFTRAAVQHVFMTIGTLMLVSLVSSAAGFINGAFAKTLDQVNWVPSSVLTPLTYLGGVFYSVTLLPPWAQKLSLVDPIWWPKSTNFARSRAREYSTYLDRVPGSVTA